MQWSFLHDVEKFILAFITLLVENIRESLCIDLCKDSGSVGLPILKQRIDPEMGIEDPGEQYQAIENLQKLGLSFVQLAVMLCPRGFLYGKMVGVLVISFRV